MKQYRIDFTARCVIEAENKEEALQIFRDSSLEEICCEIVDEQLIELDEI